MNIDIMVTIFLMLITQGVVARDRRVQQLTGNNFENP
jgi:hypothetical protein